ncbi:uncharacterized protein LOC126904498 isoform X2 [Daktulosphaira vitifoliae]|uniref:uncharacterized protein LOC126904498 isoform X2 n=1 Tax=Daktulosphaira vitifoliae TaxID=58002 RepID=UPI0021A9B191|nr:uncharacterized protein LOC126904498 isoform X2 [Daktulosphaira vitifoliae]
MAQKLRNISSVSDVVIVIDDTTPLIRSVETQTCYNDIDKKLLKVAKMWSLKKISQKKGLMTLFFRGYVHGFSLRRNVMPDYDSIPESPKWSKISLLIEQELQEIIKSDRDCDEHSINENNYWKVRYISENPLKMKLSANKRKRSVSSNKYDIGVKKAFKLEFSPSSELKEQVDINKKEISVIVKKEYGSVDCKQMRQKLQNIKSEIPQSIASVSTQTGRIKMDEIVLEVAQTWSLKEIFKTEGYSIIFDRGYVSGFASRNFEMPNGFNNVPESPLWNKIINLIDKNLLPKCDLTKVLHSTNKKPSRKKSIKREHIYKKDVLEKMEINSALNNLKKHFY